MVDIALARIKIDNKYLLILDDELFEKEGEVRYVLIGGSLTFKNVCRPFLESIGANKFEGRKGEENDFRFQLPKRSLGSLLGMIAGNNSSLIESANEAMRRELVEELCGIEEGANVFLQKDFPEIRFAGTDISRNHFVGLGSRGAKKSQEVNLLAQRAVENIQKYMLYLEKTEKMIFHNPVKESLKRRPKGRSVNETVGDVIKSFEELMFLPDIRKNKKKQEKVIELYKRLFVLLLAPFFSDSDLKQKV